MFINTWQTRRNSYSKLGSKKLQMCSYNVAFLIAENGPKKLGLKLCLVLRYNVKIKIHFLISPATIDVIWRKRQCLIPVETSLGGTWRDNTGQLKKEVTISHVYNEVTSEPTITRYTTIVRKTLKVCL
jgi:hypothetical protein